MRIVAALAWTPVLLGQLLLGQLLLGLLLLGRELPGQDPAGHWAYRAPVRPAVAAGDARHPVDQLLEARMAGAGLRPAAAADRRTLIRRVTLDLIGLPPTPAEVAAFVADARPDAYARLVDRLLASPHFGERWARPWLDLARYADSNGFNFDRPREMWLYRDWVIDALNRDLPFDEFTIEQLAGDLLPDADDRDRIATAFHRNTMLNNEGGVDPDEARWERLLDRASTTATVWLGSTFHCARCHDHKYDPITQREFYGLVAFFETQDEVTLELPSAAQRRARAAIDVELEAARAGGDEAAVEALQDRREKIDVDTVLVLREKRGDDVVAATRLHPRGGFAETGELVEAHVTAALHPWPEGAPRDRLGLARWLVDAQNPLVARVHVNRIWDVLFGAPLVGTPEDFGVQAAAPLHQDVLDWLATELVRLDWRQKPLIRQLVLTAAYRRDPAASAAARAADPGNHYLARGQRFRLEAEQVRDQALAISGLLSPRIGGPSVFPVQADTSGAIALNKVDMRWRPSRGADRYRRGLYTFWRRTAPFVQLAVFDAPSREECVVRRERTNTPLQALVGLNDPALWEAAAALGRRMREHGGDDRARLRSGFELCTCRPPTPRELELLDAALGRELAAPGADPDRAWALIANSLLNLDEVLTRG